MTEEELKRILNDFDDRLRNLERAANEEGEEKDTSIWGRIKTSVSGGKKEKQTEKGDPLLLSKIDSYWNALTDLKRKVFAWVDYLQKQLKKQDEQISTLQEEKAALERQLEAMASEARKNLDSIHSLQNAVHSLIYNNVKERSAMGDDFLRMLRAFKVLQEDVWNAIRTVNANKRDEFRQWCNHALKCALLNHAVMPYQQEDNEEQAKVIFSKIQAFTAEFQVVGLYSQYEGTDVENFLIFPIQDDEYNHEIHDSRGSLVADMACEDSQYCINFAWVIGLRVPEDASKTVKAIVNIKERQLPGEVLGLQSAKTMESLNEGTRK